MVLRRTWRLPAREVLVKGPHLSGAMITMGWNCRTAVQELERLLHTHRPQLVFLSETRQRKDVVESLRWRLGLKHVVSFHEEGKGGGLALFWHENVEVELFKINSSIIDVIIHDIKKGIKWRCTFVYGEPRTHMRYLMWDLIKRIKPLMNLPWLMMGDFNETMWQSEHLSKKKKK
jgi:hypothetical protein